MDRSLRNKLKDLIKFVDNFSQKRSLEKLLENNDNNKLYIHSISLYEPPEPINNDIINLCTFKILGANYYDLTNNKSSRQIYTINIYRNINYSNSNYKSTFDCSCKDFCSRSSHDNKVCKHVCFIICKFGQIFDIDYFNSYNKIMNDDKLTTILNKAKLFNNFNINDDDINNFKYISKMNMDVLDCFQINSNINKQIQNMFHVDNKTLTKEKMSNFICAICCDSEINIDILTCPDCHNYIHKQCMEIWLNKRNSNKLCVYCRSDIWDNYN